MKSQDDLHLNKVWSEKVWSDTSNTIRFETEIESWYTIQDKILIPPGRVIGFSIQNALMEFVNES